MIRQTSIEAYNTIKENGLLSKRRWEVYDILFHHGPLTAHEVVQVARKQYPYANQTSFNARLSELKKEGVAIEVGSKTNEVSGVSNYLWDVTSGLPIKYDKPKIIKCPTCNGTGGIEHSQAKLF